jgi:pimeloyl-ACP methyl ester carboxylesterase
MKSLLFIIVLIATSCTKQKPFLDKRLKTYKYPYKTKIYNYLSQSQKVSMDYQLKEKKKKEYAPGKTVIFLHDINTVGAQWQSLADLFFKEGYRILIPDMVGAGRSLKPEGYQYSTNSYAYMIKKFIKWYQLDKPLLIGSGFGSDILHTYTKMSDANYSKAFLINPTFFIGENPYSNYMSIDQIYEKELGKSLEQISEFIKSKVDTNKPEGAHLLWLHQGQRQGIDWRELAFTRAKIMHHYVYSRKDFANLAPRTQIIYGKSTAFQAASYFKTHLDYSKKIKANFKGAIAIESSSFHPEIDNPQQVFKEIKLP